VREAVARSLSYAETLRRLSMRAAGGNPRTLKKWLRIWGISTDHFDPNAARGWRRGRRIALEAVLVADSTYHRGHLKERLYEEGLKERRCELCGQDEIWRGTSMSLILDHANGKHNDNRIENLRIVCPNCAATFDTHCGRNLPRPVERQCKLCSRTYRPKRPEQRYCSSYCGSRGQRRRGSGSPRPESRKVERPPYDQLLREVAQLGYSAVGRRYGVSDNAVRKWIRWYEAALPTAPEHAE
jgi:transposase-like protein